MAFRAMNEEKIIEPQGLSVKKMPENLCDSEREIFTERAENLKLGGLEEGISHYSERN